MAKTAKIKWLYKNHTFLKKGGVYTGTIYPASSNSRAGTIHIKSHLRTHSDLTLNYPDFSLFEIIEVEVLKGIDKEIDEINTMGYRRG